MKEFYMILAIKNKVANILGFKALRDPMQYATTVNVLSLIDQHLLCESALSESALS